MAEILTQQEIDTLLSNVSDAIKTEKVEEVAAATMDKMGVYFPFYFAPYKRMGTVSQLNLRKPNIGMAELAFEDWGEPDLENSYMVGEYISDQVFAENLGIKYIDIEDFLDGQ